MRTHAAHLATLYNGTFAERKLENGQGAVGKFSEWHNNRYSELVEGCLCDWTNLRVHSGQNQTTESKRKAGNLFYAYRTETNRTSGVERKEGELLALEWSDIDFQKGIISVSKSCHDGKDDNGQFARITDTPKTETSEREIPFPKQLIPYLRNLKKDSNSVYVIASDSDKLISVRAYQRSFELFLKRLHIPHKGFHSLRHTFATRALECGMDVKTLSEILGHKNANVTLNRYVHSLMEHKREMMNRLGKLL